MAAVPLPAGSWYHVCPLKPMSLRYAVFRRPMLDTVLQGVKHPDRPFALHFRNFRFGRIAQPAQGIYPVIQDSPPV